jgi:hypothetical protein
MQSFAFCVSSLLVTASFANTWPPEAPLSNSEKLALEAAVNAVLPKGVTIEELYAFKEQDDALLGAHAISNPYDIDPVTFSVDAVACTKPEEGWKCQNYATLTHVYVGSIEQSFWLKDGVTASDAVLILTAALRDCDLNFALRYRARPQVSYSAGDKRFRLWAPGCHYQYRIIDGAVQREEDSSLGTPGYGT